MNTSDVAKVALKLLEAGMKDEAQQILEGATKVAFGWKKLPKHFPQSGLEWQEFLITLNDILVKNKHQRGRIPYIKNSVYKKDVIDPIFENIIAYKKKQPWFRLQKHSSAQLIKDLQRSPHWRLFEKSGKRVLFTTKKEAKDRISKRDDLVFVADVRPTKDIVALYLAHLEVLGTPLFPLLNQFDRIPTKTEGYPEGTAFHWVFDDTVMGNDPTLERGHDAAGIAVWIVQKDPSSRQQYKETVQEMLSRVLDHAQGQARTAYEHSDTQVPYKEWLKTFYYDVFFDHESYSKLHPYDKKLLKSFFEPQTKYGFYMGLTISSL